MNSSDRLRKTDAGVVAIKERDRSLAPRARTLLILVDGVKTAAQLAALNSDATQGMDLLEQLVQNGFVSVVEGAAAAAPAAAELRATAAAPAVGAGLAPANTPAPAVARDLKTSIRAATRFLEGWMGPASETMCLQIERCKSVGEFEAKIQEIKSLLANARSASKAEEFAAAALGG